MPQRSKIVCQCGGEIPRPMPTHCPHCGAQIVGVRRPLWTVVWPVLAVALLFGALVAFLWWWVGGQT